MASVKCCAYCGAERPDEVSLGKLTVSYSPLVATYDNVHLKTTPSETLMLYQLVRRGRASMDGLALLPNGQYASDTSIRSRIVSLRRLLAAAGVPVTIHNIFSYGYSISKDAA